MDLLTWLIIWQCRLHATNPLSVDKNSIDEETINREKKYIFRTGQNGGKPENIIDKMVDGRLKKFFQEKLFT